MLDGSFRQARGGGGWVGGWGEGGWGGGWEGRDGVQPAGCKHEPFFFFFLPLPNSRKRLARHIGALLKDAVLETPGEGGVGGGGHGGWRGGAGGNASTVA